MVERKVDHTNTVCCICGGKETGKNFNNGPIWIRYIVDEKGNYDRYGYWDRKSRICTKCYSGIRNNMEDSYNNAKKLVANSRTGNLDRSCNTGEAIISQWICAKVLGIRDVNIENNNFNESVDLSLHPVYGIIEIKNGKWIGNREYWQVDNLEKHFDKVFVLCGDMYKPWKIIERVYILPRSEVKGSIVIVKDPSRISKWEKFRVDERPYNEMYHGVDIPKYFSPFDLWKGIYDKKAQRRA